MVMFMKDSGKMIKQKEKVNINISMTPATLDNGKRISNMVSVMKLGLMVLNLKENTAKGKNMEKGNSFGLMEVNTRESS